MYKERYRLRNQSGNEGTDFLLATDGVTERLERRKDGGKSVPHVHVADIKNRC